MWEGNDFFHLITLKSKNRKLEAGTEAEASVDQAGLVLKDPPASASWVLVLKEFFTSGIAFKN